MQRAPATFIYLFVLSITTWVLETSSTGVAKQLLVERSTNLLLLVEHPFKVLMTSAFWVTSTTELLLSILLFTLIASQFERWVGSGRIVVAFFLGHIGASLLVAFWIWASLNFTIGRTPETTGTDVGSSYGFASIAALYSYKFTGPMKLVYLSIIVGIAAITLVWEPSFTNWGHLIAIAIGFGSYLLIPRRLRHKSVPD